MSDLLPMEPWPPEGAELIVEGIVIGDAKTAGSKISNAVTRFDPVTKKRVPVFKDGRVVVSTKEDDKTGEKQQWRGSVRDAVLEAFAGNSMIRCPLACELTTVRVRPKSHYGTGKNDHLLKPSAPRYPTASSGKFAGDAGKLARAFEDALNAIVWEDDALNVDLRTRKLWEDRWDGGPPRMEFRIWGLPEMADVEPEGQESLALA